jgi:predicted GNAT family N-acyltransferase
MAVLPQARGRGCGRAILNALIAEAKRFGYRRIELSAQTHALAFYEKLGFEPFGPEYLDCNIKHRRMQMKLI